MYYMHTQDVVIRTHFRYEDTAFPRPVTTYRVLGDRAYRMEGDKHRRIPMRVITYLLLKHKQLDMAEIRGWR